MHPDVIVLGAGLTSSAVALELGRRGVACALLERHPLPVAATSLRNEGKIHLGLVYAADASFTTAEYQLRGALSFAPLLERWARRDCTEALNLSTPFAYLVAPDSLLCPADLEQHYRRVEARFGELCARFPRLHYLGSRPGSLLEAVDDGQVGAWYPHGQTPRAFSTRELAVDTEGMAGLVRELVAAETLVDFRGRHRVERVERSATGFDVTAASREGSVQLSARILVNCTWENRLFFDRQLGHAIHPGHLHRLKFRLNIALPDHLRTAPSATRVLGPYGDVVIRRRGSGFLSWYPASLRGWCDDIRPPDSWLPAMSGEIDAGDCPELGERILEGMESWFPAVRDCRVESIDAGVILAWGKTDIDERGSRLHSRDIVGGLEDNGYWSVEAGKLTTAPLVGFECATRIADQLEGLSPDGYALCDSLLDRI